MSTRRTIAIVQSSYIPWRGFFDLINAVDEFVLLDDVQYTRRDWRNRNRIKTRHGIRWLTIPVEVKGRFHQKILETRVSDSRWVEKHWNALCLAYAEALFFDQYKDLFEELYLGCDELFLSRINHRFLTALCGVLGIKTRLTWSTDYELHSGKTERLVAICQQAGATDYLSGPAARSYLDAESFARAGVGVHWMDYSGYSEYRQLHGPFDPSVSIVDLIFNEGVHAPRFLKTSAET